MAHMIDVRGVPISALVKGFLDAMSKNQAETWLIYKQGNTGAHAANRPTAEALARTHLSIKDGALEVAAIALHAWRMSPETTEEPAPSEDTRGLCSVVLCAGHELAEGKPVPWDDLPEPVKEAHRLLAKVAVSAAVAHNVPQEASRIVKV